VKLARLLELGRTIRVVGFDDAPFAKRRGAAVSVAGVVCADTRFEGMLWGRARRDGWNATDVLSAMLDGSKFRDQVRVALLDGIAVGGFNVVDLPTLHARTGLVCVAVMRRAPDMAAVRHAIERLPNAPRRLALLARAGEILHSGPFTYQVQGEDADVTARLLTRFTREGHVPECLRMAHLIGSAVMLGESGRRA
jgi:endonuclease V-like protein UPF0215 family